MDNRKGKLAYLAASIFLIIWINVALSIFGSETAIFPFILITILAIPVSFIVNLLDPYMWSIYPDNTMYASIIKSNLLILLILLAGYFQWFYFIPWMFNKFTGK